jgi:anti-sigma factor RsiW
MPCQRYAQSIQDLVDGTLGSIRTAELEQHLDTCASCQAFVADMQRIRDLAASLDRLAPPAGVWLQVAGRLRQEGRIQDVRQAPKGRQTRYAILAIAAGLLIAIGGSLFALMPLLRGGDGAGQPAVEQAAGTPGDAGSVQSIEDHFRIAEQHMQAGIAKLEEAAKADETAMDPQTAAMLKKNLDMIDQAIAESRAALRAEPQSTIARDSLFNALRRKVALLQDTIALMNEMRKGDAAGAAQVVEGLNKS